MLEARGIMNCCVHSPLLLFQILGDEEKRTRYDTGEDVDDMGSGMGAGGFNPFGGGGQQFTFHFEGGFPGGGFPGGFGGFHF